MKRVRPQLFLKRKFTRVLEAWKSRNDRLPLIVKGARQVGKTECIREFAERHYASVIEINFVLQEEFKTIIRDGFSCEHIIRNISLVEPHFRFLPNETLIFFDEIQEFPEIATCFKSFAEDGRFDVISSGSLLGIQYKRIESISVGFQETETMRSLDFEEFLTARGYRAEQLEDVYARILQAESLGDAVKNTFDRLFLDYCVLGGMPEVVESYFVKGTFEGVPAMQRRILADYHADVRKYAEGLDPVRILSVFESIPAQLAKENKKFQLATIAKGARYKDYWGCVEWLRDAGVVTVCKAMDFPELPLMAHLDASCYKLYMGDSGLLVAMLDEEAQEDVRIRRKLGTWKGGLFENIVAEALVKAGGTPTYFKKGNSTLEIDFLIRGGGSLVPIEVKAENARAKSLSTLIASDNYRDVHWGIKLVNGNVGYESKVLTIPQWCAFWVPRLAKEFKPRES